MKTNSILKSWASKLNFKFVFLVYVFFAILMAVQPIFSTIQREIDQPEHPYTEFNNYIIFKNSFFHLLEDQNLYQPFEFEQWDLFKYSPTFALLFGWFALLPDWVGLALWNLTNSLVFLWAISQLSFLSERQKTLFAILVLLEMNTNLVNSQANGLMAGLMLLFYAYQEKGRFSLGNFLLAISVFIKIFSIFGFLLLFFYPNWFERVKNALFWGFFFFLLPVSVCSPGTLIHHYANWIEMLRADGEFGAGLSLHRFLTMVTSVEFEKSITLLAGLFVFLFTFVFAFKKRKDFLTKNLFWSQLMIWVVIFNHRAESPTFLIAISGIFLGMFNFYEQKRLFIWASLITVALTSLVSTDLVSSELVKKWLFHYSIKALPSIVAWGAFVALILTESSFKKQKLENLTLAKNVSCYKN